MEFTHYTILVVEDEETIRDLVVTFISRLGHSCVEAIDGDDALVKMKENKINGVVTDIRMPGMDGITLTKEILRQYPGLPVMVMTGFSEESTGGIAITAGASEFIQKPFSVEEFTIRLQKMLKDSETIKQIRSEKDEDDKIFDLKRELEGFLKRS